MAETDGSSTDYHRRLVDASPDGLLVFRDGSIHFANPAAVNLLGLPDGGQIPGEALLDRFSDQSRQLVANAIARVSQGAPLFPVEATLLDSEGQSRDVELMLSRLGDTHRAPVQIALRDITARKARERALRDSEERLRLAFAGAKEGVYDWTLETGAVVYSSRWKQMLGYEDDEIAPSVRSWEDLLHPDDRQRADALLAEAQEGRDSYEGELRLRHKAGYYITVLTRGLPIRRPGDGRVVRIVGTHLDITESKRTEMALRESEERLRLAFAGAQEGIWDWDLETDAVVYSSRWKQMLGYEDHEIEPHISAWERLVHPDDRKDADKAHASVTLGAPTYHAEFRLRHKAGHYVHVLSRGFPVRRDAGGPVIRIVGTHFDLTHQRERESVRARNELLSHLVFVQEDERKRIARDMHDQFGEHLTTLSLQIASLKDACAQNPGLSAQAVILEQIAERLDREVEQLVWQLRPTALDDLGLRAALTNYLREWSQRHDVAAELHTSGLMDERLIPDVETALYRIAQEALNNVAKHAQANRVEVILERRADRVLLIVEDDGVGFVRENTRSARHGFGLVGMQERAALIGATLEIDSTHGRGTTILVRMPVAAHAPQSVDHV